MTVLSSKEIICPYCYLATQLTLSTEPRIPATGMLWLCNECKELAVFTDSLDLREATPEEKAKAIL
jgi:hypothetical protein